MAKLYYGNGQCTIEGNAYGIEINYKGTINIEDKTSEGFALISNERRIIIFPTGIVGEVVLNELFDYTGQLKILSIIVSNEQGEREYCTIHKVMDYAELLNTKAEDLTTNSEDLSSGYSSEKGLNKTAIAKQKIIPNIHTSDHNGLLYLKNRSVYEGYFHVHLEDRAAMTGSEHTSSSEDLYIKQVVRGRRSERLVSTKMPARAYRPRKRVREIPLRNPLRDK